jgi:hypothetical protein
MSLRDRGRATSLSRIARPALALAVGVTMTAALMLDAPSVSAELFYRLNHVPMVLPPPGSLQVLGRWEATVAGAKSWRVATSPGWKVSPAPSGVRISTTSEVNGYQIAVPPSPGVTLVPGLYRFSVDATVISGGLTLFAQAGKSGEVINSPEAFWSGSRNMGRFPMTLDFALAARTEVRVVLANWNPTGSSRWLLRSISLAKVSSAEVSSRCLDCALPEDGWIPRAGRS